MMRAMLDNDTFDQNGERVLNMVMYDMIRTYLSEGFNVISDNMNLDPKHLVMYDKIVFDLNTNLLRTLGLPIEINLLDFYVPIEVCSERDSKRANPVTESVIRKIHGQWFVDDLMPDPYSYMDLNVISHHENIQQE
jgi:predicted kinase